MEALIAPEGRRSFSDEIQSLETTLTRILHEPSQEKILESFRTKLGQLRSDNSTYHPYPEESSCRPPDRSKLLDDLDSAYQTKPVNQFGGYFSDGENEDNNNNANVEDNEDTTEKASTSLSAKVVPAKPLEQNSKPAKVIQVDTDEEEDDEEEEDEEETDDDDDEENENEGEETEEDSNVSSAQPETSKSKRAVSYS